MAHEINTLKEQLESTDRLQGEWFGTVCSNCGESTPYYYDCNYCPNCGAKMKGGDTE